MASSVIGQAVKEERRQANMTVRELAELVPADDRTIFRYEAEGRIRPDVLARLVQIFRSKDLAECYCRECPVRKVKFKGRQLPRYGFRKKKPAKSGLSKLTHLFYHNSGRDSK